MHFSFFLVLCFSLAGFAVGSPVQSQEQKLLSLLGDDSDLFDLDDVLSDANLTVVNYCEQIKK